jgi:hypothetical protein
VENSTMLYQSKNEDTIMMTINNNQDSASPRRTLSEVISTIDVDVRPDLIDLSGYVQKPSCVLRLNHAPYTGILIKGSKDTISSANTSRGRKISFEISNGIYSEKFNLCPLNKGAIFSDKKLKRFLDMNLDIRYLIDYKYRTLVSCDVECPIGILTRYGDKYSLPWIKVE